MLPSHEQCLRLLADPSTKNILETFGFEYGPAGFAQFRTERPDIVAVLVQAITTELAQHPIFPERARERLPAWGLYIKTRPDGFELTDSGLPSDFNSYVHPTAEVAARSYVYRKFDRYWLQFDRVMVFPSAIKGIQKS